MIASLYQSPACAGKLYSPSLGCVTRTVIRAGKSRLDAHRYVATQRLLYDKSLRKSARPVWLGHSCPSDDDCICTVSLPPRTCATAHTFLSIPACNPLSFNRLPFGRDRAFLHSERRNSYAAAHDIHIGGRGTGLLSGSCAGDRRTHFRESLPVVLYARASQSPGRAPTLTNGV